MTTVAKNTLDAIRTHDLPLRRRLLYPAELPGLLLFVILLLPVRMGLRNFPDVWFCGVSVFIPHYLYYHKHFSLQYFFYKYLTRNQIHTSRMANIILIACVKILNLLQKISKNTIIKKVKEVIF